MRHVCSCSYNHLTPEAPTEFTASCKQGQVQLPRFPGDTPLPAKVTNGEREYRVVEGRSKMPLPELLLEEGSDRVEGGAG